MREYLWQNLPVRETNALLSEMNDKYPIEGYQITTWSLTHAQIQRFARDLAINPNWRREIMRWPNIGKKSAPALIAALEEAMNEAEIIEGNPLRLYCFP